LSTVGNIERMFHLTSWNLSLITNVRLQSCAHFVV